MKKYKIYQQGGDATGAEQFNGYVDQLLAAQQDLAQTDQPTNVIQPEEESDYIKALRDYDEQDKPNSEEYFKAKLDYLTDLFDNKINELKSKQNEYDWFASDEGNDYLANQYDTQQQTLQPKQDDNGGKNNYGNIRGGDGNFLSFDTPEAGRMALLHQLSLYQTGRTRNPVKPTSTLYEAMAVYAPAADNNNPKHYAEFVAKQLGIDPNTQIQNINTNKWADAITQMEGNKNIGH